MELVPESATGIVVFLLSAIVCLLVGTVCIVSASRLCRRQIKLHHSIRLVELRSVKLHYLFFLMVDFGCLVVTVLALLGAFRPEFWSGNPTLVLPELFTMISLGCTVYLLTGLGFMLTVLLLAKSAVVDKGIFTSSYYLDWYHVHDYIIDESTGKVTLSTNRETFGTIRGTTSPLRVTKNDIPKLKFILNKNKNKFSA